MTSLCHCPSGVGAAVQGNTGHICRLPGTPCPHSQSPWCLGAGMGTKGWGDWIASQPLVTQRNHHLPVSREEGQLPTSSPNSQVAPPPPCQWDGHSEGLTLLLLSDARGFWKYSEDGEPRGFCMICCWSHLFSPFSFHSSLMLPDPRLLPRGAPGI
jgi:hypothetical protein